MRVDPFLRAHRGLVVLLAAVLPVLTCLLLTLARDAITSATAVLILVVLIVAAAATGLRAAALLSASVRSARLQAASPHPSMSVARASMWNVDMVVSPGRVGSRSANGRRTAAAAIAVTRDTPATML